MWIVDIWSRPIGSWTVLDVLGVLAAIFIGIPAAFTLLIRLFAFICDALGIRIPPPK